MKFTSTLIKGKLIKRYKRFFTDIKVNSQTVTAHCPNTGSMLGLLEQGNDVWLTKNDNPKRKLKYTLEIIKVNKSLIGVNTHRANKIVEHGLNNKLISDFKNIKTIKPEFKYSSDTRFDFLCDKNIIEVKNVTLRRENDTAEFPDSVTSRGSKHLIKLINSLKSGYKPFVLFLTQIQDIRNFRIAKDIDNEYYNNYLLAKKAGVKFLAYRCVLSSTEIKIEKKIKIIDER
jgi:sugar fermentation stimulation protein A